MCSYCPCFCAKTTTRLFWNDHFAHLISGIGTETFPHISAGGCELLDFFFMRLCSCSAVSVQSDCVHFSTQQYLYKPLFSQNFILSSKCRHFGRNHFHQFRVTCVSVFVHVQTHKCLLEVCLSWARACWHCHCSCKVRVMASRSKDKSVAQQRGKDFLKGRFGSEISLSTRIYHGSGLSGNKQSIWNPASFNKWLLLVA
jgi:hypothetical protein